MNLADTGIFVGDRMSEILSVFSGGQKITVIVRTPGNDDADFIMSSESDLEDAKAAVQRRIDRGHEAG